MSKENFYETIANDFDSIMNSYDVNRRIEVIFRDFLGNEDLQGKKILDAGCGTGLFTKIAVDRGADVSSIDISPSLVEITRAKCPKANVFEGSILSLPFNDSSFDIVFSSDVIEHTPDPLKATDELIRVLKTDGKLCITVPNRSFWFFSVRLANLLKIRKYQGYENWVHYFNLKKYLCSKNIELVDYKGIHLFPFVVSFLNPLLYKLDKIFEKKLGFLMVNIAAFGIKKKK